ncbi:MAG TPA: hypothetical protein VEP90_05570 [Methylomirabilota bacterium]|nr:hypothetical protein [Methylomirabilota bacterium]
MSKEELYAILREAVENTVRIGKGRRLLTNSNPWSIVDESGKVLVRFSSREKARQKLKVMKLDNPNVKLIRKAA